jgi:hypothetical protein
MTKVLRMVKMQNFLAASHYSIWGMRMDNTHTHTHTHLREREGEDGGKK